MVGAPGASNGAAARAGDLYLLSIAGSTLSVPNSTQTGSAATTGTATTTTSGTTPLPPARPEGYGLSESFQCVLGGGGCQGGDSTAFTDTSETSTTPVNQLIAARHMHIFRFGVDWMTFMTLPGKKVTEQTANGQTVVISNPQGQCGPVTSTGTPTYDTSTATNCGGLVTFMQWVQAHEQGGTPVVEITMSRNYTNGKPYKAPTTPAMYQTALERISHYVNQVLYQQDGGIHVRFWGAWNEPDEGNEPAGQSGPLAAAKYALAAHQILEKHVKAAATSSSKAVMTGPMSDTGCALTGPQCTVIAGTFGNYDQHSDFVNRYIHTIRGYGRDGADLWVPSIWSYHAYDDISAGGPMLSTFDMIAHIKNQSWAKVPVDGSATKTAPPQIWMDEGAAVLMNGPTTYSLDEPTPAVNGNSCGPVADPVTAGVAPKISQAVERFLSFTNTFVPSQLPDAKVNFGIAEQVNVALYYEFSSGGNGTAWATNPGPWCSVSTSNVAVAPGASAPTRLSGFDSGLFESNGELDTAVANNAPGAVAGHLRPRYAYCVLAAKYYNSSDSTYFDPETAQDPDCRAGDYGTQVPDISQYVPSYPSS